MFTEDELGELITERLSEALAAYNANAARIPEVDLVDGMEMARRLSVSKTTLHRLRIEGMPTVRVGDVYRYRPQAVLDWLEKRGSE